MQRRPEKPSANFTQNFFLMLNCEFLIVMSIYGLKLCLNSFSVGKSRKNDIPEIKITLSLLKIPQNYRFP